MSITKEYIHYHNLYKKKYKSIKTLVLMQVGSFYEAYATNEEGPNLHEISNILNIVCTKRDKKITETNIKNPYMIGFPKVAEAKFINVLIDNNYTVIVIDQVTPPPEPKREVTGIYSQGVYMNGNVKPDNNFVTSVYLEEEKQKNGSYIMCGGLTAIDISTGQNLIYEAYSNSTDMKYTLDETIRFLNSINPSEIIIYYNNNNNNSDIKEIIKYLDIDTNKILHIKDKINPQYLKLSYQNEFLKKVYPESNGLISPIDYLDLERNPYIVVRLIILLDFLYDHNKSVIKNINKPNFYFDNSNLILGNNCINQLNIVDNYGNMNINNKLKSVFDVVNNTSTSLGRRLLRSRLISPLVDGKKLKKEYNFIEELLKNNLYLQIEDKLKNIIDIERLERRILLEQIHPFEFVKFIASLKETEDIIDNFIDNNKNLKKLTVKDRIHFDNIFNLEEMNYSLNDITGNIFLPGIYKDIDELDKKIIFQNSFLEKLADVLSLLIDNKKDNIKVQTLNSGGHYLIGSKKRVDILKKKIKEKDHIFVDDYCMNIDKFIFKENTNNTKIFFDDIYEKSDEINNLKKELEKLTKKYFIESVKEMYNKNKECILKLRTFVSYIDMYKSNAKTAKLYGYNKPEILNDTNDSFIECKKLRHPIIERLIDYEYIPHDITLGKDTKGILLYGLNSSGKSSVMKALGICLIMAQAGMYVPAECTFTPYLSLYTRITGNDNLFKGLSSFSLEMLELKAILNRSGKRTLVIGDEICRGTENISANAIVASTIIKLSELESCFIFATHLHDIVNLNRIKNLKNVKPYHLSVSYDNKKDCLVYDRILKEGSGEDIYGITVAKYIIKDKEFVNLALDIKNELLGDYGSLISGKTSKYNSQVLIHECQLCEKKDILGHISNLQTHHINFQKNCTNGFVNNKKYLKKNDKANLIVLCTECHDKIHRGEKEIKKKTQTTNGLSH